MGAALSWTGKSGSGLENGVVWMGVAAMGVLILLPLAGRSSGENGRRAAERLRGLIRDPVVLMACAFTLVLILQLWNSGRELVFFPFDNEWRYTPPPHGNLPWAIRTDEARQMLTWFLPALVGVICLRHGLGRAGVQVTYGLLVINALFVACSGLHGLTQHEDQAHAMLPPDRFATFTYQNHAGAFFLIVIGISIGLAASFAPRRGRRPCYLIVALFVVVALLGVAAAYLSLSRATFVFTTIYLAGVLAWLAAVYLPRLSPPARLQFGLVAGVIVISVGFIVAGGNREWVVRELKGLTPKHVKESVLSRDRAFQIDAAFRIWLDSPVYGVGGWGYRHLLPLYIDSEDTHRMRRGTANVHCDPVQFLTEFGVLGAGLLFGMLCVTGAPVCDTRALRSRMIVFPLAGCFFVLAWSIIDLPFRHPAVLYHWILVLAGSAVFMRTRTTEGVSK